jgi:hypothetical protein
MFLADYLAAVCIGTRVYVLGVWRHRVLMEHALGVEVAVELDHEPPEADIFGSDYPEEA